jgi:biotin carboxylase/predicted transcriptional regulator YdeE
MSNGSKRFLCIASYEKGHDFLRQLAVLGVRPTLLTVEKLRDAAWPREALEDLATMPAGLSNEQILNTVCWMARGRYFDRIIALDEFDLEIAARLREHMRIEGMGTTTTAFYRDKLAMRMGAQKSGFLVPEFCRVLNYDELRAYMERVPAPWLLKPRSEASALGIRKISEPEQLWRVLDELGDRQSTFLLEQFVPGEIFHVDSIVSEGEVVISAVHQYGRPPMQVMHDGGVFTTRTVDRSSRAWTELTAINAALAPALGMERGVTHAEYICSHADGRFYFLEIAARVGGAFIAELIHAATGVNLWREWASLEVAHLRGESYTPPDAAPNYAGSVLCLAKMAEPDTSTFNAPEIVLRMKKEHHAGLIVRSGRPERVRELIEQFSEAFAAQFLATMPLRPGLQLERLPRKEATMNRAESTVIATWPSTHDVFLERIGPFYETAPAAWKGLHARAVALRQHNEICGAMALYRVEGQVYRAGFALASAPRHWPEALRYKLLPGGTFKRFILTGPYSDLPEATGRVWQLVTRQCLALRNDFAIENYVNNPNATPAEDLVTEILIPVVESTGAASF